MNNITDLLDLEDSDIKISDIIIEGQTKTLIIETPPVASYCPICGFRMHSRGVKKRTINHPMPAFVELPVTKYSCEDKPAAVISYPICSIYKKTRNYQKNSIRKQP